MDWTETGWSDRIRPDALDRDWPNGSASEGAAWNALAANLAWQIQQAPNLQAGLQALAEGTRQLLGCDRILLYPLHPEQNDRLTVEAVSAPQWSLADRGVPPLGWDALGPEPDGVNRFWAVAEIAAANLSPSAVLCLQALQASALLAVPVRAGQQPWGLLVAHSCSGPRPWRRSELEGLQQIAVQAGLAIYQANLVADLQAARAEISALRQQIDSQPGQQARALRESQARFQAFMTHAPILTWLVDVDGIVSFANPAWLSFVGHTAQSAIGHPFDRLFPAEFAQEYGRNNQQVIDTGEVLETLEQALSPEGQVHTFLVRKFPVYQDQQIAWVGGIAIDITERMQIEDALRASDLRWQFALEGAGDGLWDWNAQTNEVFFSHQWKAMLGYEDSDIGTSLEEWDKRVHPEDKAQCYADLASHFSGDVPFYQNEHRVLCKDGSYRWVLDRGKVLQWTEEGKPLRVIGTHTDISDRKRTEFELRDSKAQLEDFFDNANDLIQSVSLQDGRLLYVNRAWRKTLGYSSDDIKTLTIFDLLAPQSLALGQNIFQQLRSGQAQTVAHVEVAFLAKDGRIVLLEGSINVRFENDQPIATRAILRDVTAQRQADRVLQEQAEILRIFYETSPLMMGTVEISENDIFHTSDNPTTLEFFGLSPDLLHTRSASELGVSADVLQLWLTYYRQSQQQQKPIQFEYEHVDQTKTCWLSVTVSYLGLGLSERPRFSYIVQDISEKKRVEAERQRADAMQRQAEQIQGELKLLENILEISLAGYWDWDILTNCEYLSPGFKRMFGYQDHELPNSPESWQQLIFPEDLTVLMACFEQHVSSQGEVPLYSEVRYRHRDGSTVWVICSGQVIEWDAAGHPLRAIGCHIDITNRKTVEEQLSQSESTNRAILAAIPDLLLRVGRGGTCYNFLPPADERSGTFLPVHQHLSEILPADLLAQQLQGIEQALASGEPQIWEQQILKHGDVCQEEVRIIPCGAEDCLIIVRDITQRKRIEETLRKSEATNRALIEAIPDMLIRMRQDGVHLDVIHEGGVKCLYSGPAADEQEGLSVIDVLPLPIAHERIRLAQLAVETGEIQYQEYAFAAGGHTFYEEARITPLWDHDVLVVVRDISHQKQAEIQLKTTEMQLSSILNSSLDGIMAFRSVRDEQGQIIDFEWLLSNPTACTLVGRSVNQLIGQRLLQEMPGNRDEGLFDQYVEVVKSGEPLQRQFYYSQDGVDCWFENIAVKLGDGFVVTFRNITAVKQSEQALQQANALLESHLSNLQQRNQEMQLLSETSDFLQACLTLKEACAVITSLVEPLFPGCSGGIFMTSASRNRVENVASWGTHLHSRPDFGPHDCWGLRRGRLHWVGEGRMGLLCNHVHDPAGLADTLCIPMIAQGETLGLFYLNAETAGALPETKQQLARTVAEQVALAIANLHLRETLQHQSIRDPLTGLFNRRYLEETLQQEILRAQRHQHSIGVIMIDVDHFKRFNDTYGHEAGDQVLQAVGKLLKESVRGSDVACRYGGEEMTLVLPESSLGETQARAEEIRVALSQLQVSQNGRLLDSLTASFGVACFPQHGAMGSALVQAADAALYRAKAAGRNRVVVAS
jgi:diguanylate cyclase (GGDEF)-like protein/PAS domain S-box-containing protein